MWQGGREGEKTSRRWDQKCRVSLPGLSLQTEMNSHHRGLSKE